LIASAAADYGASVVRRRAAKTLFTVPYLRADGAVTSFRIIAEATGARVSAREEKPSAFPAFCPERHVNAGGTFCMNWEKGDPIKVVDDASAARWWSTLLGYLRLQERAQRLGRWPKGQEWAHGDAAVHQRAAETAAAVLNPGLLAAVRAGELSVCRKRRTGGTFLKLLRGDATLFSVWEREGRVATLRQRCICTGSGLPFASCGNHAEVAAELAFAIRAWAAQEARFWADLGSQECCGWSAGCPLRQPALKAA
jgi:hypothetical protein